MQLIRLYFIVFVLLIFNLTGIAYANSSLANGFQGLIWGQNLNDFSEKNSMQDVSAPLRGKELGKDEFAYKRFNHDSIGGVSQFNILYFFWHDQFEAINAYSQGRDKFDKLTEAIIHKYGKPTYIENNQYFNRMVWTNNKVEMVMAMSGDDNLVHFYMKSLIIEKEKMRWEKANKPVPNSGW